MAMNDINFEELDKAVSSVLQKNGSAPGGSAENTAAAADDAASVPQLDESQEASKSTDQAMASDAAATEPVSQKTSSVVLPKRRGQFMDMVHPSSDMRQVSARPVATRASTILQPLDPSVVETNSAPVVASDAKDQTSSTSEDKIAEQAPPNNAHASVWPDPLDIAEQLESQTQSEIPEQAAAEALVVPEIEDDPQVAQDEHDKLVQTAIEAPSSGKTEDNDTSDAESPFISGTEVEKRPLGAFASNGEVSVASNVEGAGGDMPAAENVEPTMPEELAPEVVSVESDDLSTAHEELDAKPVEDSSTGVAQSIAPQYKTEGVASDESEDHTVFDTQQYHQPLTPPVKAHGRGRGLFYTLLFISMLLLGAAAGYIIWYLKLI